MDPGTQPKVFCQKGKCYPYDPARMKNPNLNLEMKPGKMSLLRYDSCKLCSICPGMILTPVDPPRKPQQQQQRRQGGGEAAGEGDGGARNKGETVV